MRRRTLAIMLAALFVASSTYAADKLTLGKTAPGLDIEKWVKGEEVTIENEKVYIILFFDTTNQLSTTWLPFLSELQTENELYGMEVVAISSEDTDKVESFVNRNGKNLNLSIGVDRRKSTKRAWLDAAEIRDLPAVFIIDKKGKIALMATPNPKYDGDIFVRITERVMTGRWDPVLQRKAQPLLDAAAGARKTRTWRMAEKYYNDVIELSPQVFASVALDMFEMKLIDQNKPEEAYKYAQEELIQGHFVGDPDAQAMLAVKIVSDPEIPDEKRNYDVAMNAATIALTGASQDPDAYATIALVHYHKGEIAQAINLQKKAYFMARPQEKERFKRTLKDYQKAKQRAELGKKD